jgi:eukaryotic-like serine/threonine-protein kinase
VAAVWLGAANGVTLRPADVRFPDAGTIAPVRVGVRLREQIRVRPAGGEPASVVVKAGGCGGRTAHGWPARTGRGRRRVLGPARANKLSSSRQVLPYPLLMGRWRRGKKLGWGRFGTVYEATQSDASEDATPEFAVKVLQPAWKDVDEVRKRFTREIDILDGLDHPNVMTVVDAGETGSGKPYFVMPLADGGSLKDALDDGRAGERDWVLVVFRGMLTGVAHAHDRQVCHRDIKPRNFLLFGEDDMPKASDFGVAKQLDLDGTTLTQSAQELGTLRYMAPEQLARAKDAGPPADVYSLGKVFAHMLTGQTPEAHKIDLTAVPAEFRHFVDKCCRDNPVQRYQDAGEALVAFDKLLESDEMVLPPIERAQQLIKLSEGADLSLGDPEALGDLDAHVRAHPDDAHLNRRIVPRLPRAVVERWAKEFPDGFRDAIRAFDRHVSERGGLPFEYCDVVADFYKYVFSITEDIEVERIIMTRLLPLGTGHNRFHVHDVVIELLAGLSDPAAVAVAVEAIEDNPRDASWYAEAALKRPLRQSVAAALRRTVAEPEASSF